MVLMYKLPFLQNLLSPLRSLVTILILASILLSIGCNAVSIKQQLSVPPLLTPLVDADVPQLLAEIDRFANINSIRGRVDIQFLDNSFAECGIAEKYRTADAQIILQRPGNIYLVIQVPIISQKIAEMTSDSERFRVAVLAGDEKYKKFVMGTNSATYQKIANGKVDCGGGTANKTAVERRTVSAISGLRPQHFTGAILINPVDRQSNNIYVRSENYVEEPDRRPRAKRGARIMRGYYQLDELGQPVNGIAPLLRRFWFDRFGKIRLARLQTFDDKGQLITDVRYSDPKMVGDTNPIEVPSVIELTRPQDHYSIRLTYQSPEAVVINRIPPYEPDIFRLTNKWNLPEVDLDKKGNQEITK
jgi:hypothetical protein